MKHDAHVRAYHRHVVRRWIERHPYAALGFAIGADNVARMFPHLEGKAFVR